MKRISFAKPLTLASVVAAGLASAPAQDRDALSGIQTNEPPRLNRLRLGYQMGFNVSASFRNLGGYAQSAAGPATSRTNHSYDNGYNRVDILNNNHGPGLDHTTWYWSINDQSQIHTNTDTVVMSSAIASANLASSGKVSDPQNGFQLIYDRQLGTLGERDQYLWGLEAGFGFSQISVRDSRPMMGAVQILSDSYDLGGSVPIVPLAPGTFAGPGPLIGDIPTRTFSPGPNPAIVTGTRRLDADVYGLRLGPYLEMPVSQRVGFSLSSGLVLAEVNSRFKFDETVNITGLAPIARRGSGSHDDLLVGAYVSGDFSYAFNKSWSAFAGAQYQYLGRFSQHVSGKEARLDLTTPVFVTVGFGYSF